MRQMLLIMLAPVPANYARDSGTNKTPPRTNRVAKVKTNDEERRKIAPKNYHGNSENEDITL